MSHIHQEMRQRCKQRDCNLVRQSHLSCLLMIRREGTVVSLVTSGEAFVVGKIARKLQVDIPEVDVAGGSIKLCA